MGGLLIIPASFPEAIEDVILIRRNNQLVDRKTHALCKVSCQYVAEIARRHDKAHFVAWFVGGVLEEREVCMEIVCRLRENASPVDGIDRDEI